MNILVIVFIGLASSLNLDEENNSKLYLSEQNFLAFPNYKEISELRKIPSEAKCVTSVCDVFQYNGERYFESYLLNANNFSRVIGTWSGGDCDSDTWLMTKEGNLESQYPLDGEIYSWSGKFEFIGNLYIENAINNRNEKEVNEANLYYIESADIIVYKGIRSFDSVDKNGNEKYIHYEGPDYFYFKRCKNLSNAIKHDL